MYWTRVVVLVLLLSTILVGQSHAVDQPPPSDQDFLRHVAQDRNISLDRLRVSDRAIYDYPLSGVQIHAATVVDTTNEQIYPVALDTARQPVDLPAAAALEERKKQQRYGKLDQRLFEAKATSAPSQTLPVTIWLDSSPPRLNRSVDLATHLKAMEQHVAAQQQAVVGQLAQIGVPIARAKYGPVVFAQLNPEQIDLIAKRRDVLKLYGSERYTPSGDGGSTTQRAHTVWAAGNLGAGPASRPVILEPGGVSNLNPYLNNTNHSVVYWCPSVSNTCPNGKNINDHASQVAGVVASTHPLAQGVAPAASIILSANTQDYSDAKVVAAFEWAIAQGGNPTVIGWAPECGGTQTFLSRYLDWAVRNLFATVVVAAGNHSSNCLDAAGNPDLSAGQKVGGSGVAWNVITVGSMNDAGTGFWGDDRVSDTSNWSNPDFAPGMEKPEVVAVGEGIRTTDAAGGDWLTPGGVNGTSYAAPQVAGQIALMLSRQPEQNIWPETNKAAVLASAFHDVEAGQERDGVGAVMINVSDDTYRLNRFINGSTAAGGPLQASDFPRTYENAITLEQNQRVRVAIAWDSISNGTTLDVLGADLDLCIRHPDNETIIACSTSRDNAWELVEFTAPASGQYDVVINLNQVDAGWPGTFLGVAWAIRSLPNVCTNAVVLPAEGGTFSINTAHGSAFFDAYTGWTRSQGGRERVMRLVLDTTKDITISDTNPNLDLHLVQFPTCAGDPVEPVVRGSGTNSVAVDNARPGIYYLIVDGANGAVGTTSVTVRVSGP